MAGCPRIWYGHRVSGLTPTSELSAVQTALARIAGARETALQGIDQDVLEAVLRHSLFLRRFLVRHPDAASELLDSVPAPRTKDAWVAWLDRFVPPLVGARALVDAAYIKALRVARQRALVGIVARELVTGDALATGADLAALADALVERALAAARVELEPRFGTPHLSDGSACGAVVIAMGKHGGCELNLSSDIDLLFVYESDRGQTDGAGGLGRIVDLHTYHSRLFARVASLLSEPTDEGFVFRVDLDLRPEGRTGPICNSLDSIESYYESFGHPWDRLAWIKARAAAGDVALGERVIASLRPFVYRKNLEFGFVEEIAAMKRRIDQSGARLGQKEGYNVKLGRGGLREIEFAVQTLQLTWGGRLPELRARDTQSALARLALAGLLDQVEADQLLGAYRFLRRIEHIVQLHDDRQTHVLPADVTERRRIAAALGLDEGRLDVALAEHRKRVRTCFDAVVAHVGTPSEDPVWEGAFATALELEVDPEAREAAIAELGFSRLATTRARFEQLARRPESPFHWRMLSGDSAGTGGLAKRIVRACLASADPDQALQHFESLLKALRHREAAYQQLDADPRRLRVLASLFGTSHALSRVLVRSPGLVDRLVLDGHEPAVRTRAQMAKLLADEPGMDLDWEGALGGARRFHQAEVLRIGFFDLAGALDQDAVSTQLSDLADTLIAALCEAAQRELERRVGERVPGFGVLALGRLAARELSYASELELLFVPPAQADPELSLRLARSVVTALSVATPEGVLYTIGAHGPLCIAADRLLAKHRAPATTPAERAMVLGARAIVGPPEVAALVAALTALGFGAFAASAQAVLASPEGVPSPADEVTLNDLSAGPGGLARVQTLVQRLQLTLAPAAAEAAANGDPAGSPHVPTALAGLAQLGAFAGGSDPSGIPGRIAESYRFLRRLENRLTLVQEQPLESLRLLAKDAATFTTWPPMQREHLQRLARRMGYGDQAEPNAALALHRDCQRHRATLAELTTIPVPRS